jgi:zinc protease
VSSKGESITGGCVKKDLETLLQLTYLCFTSPRKDEAAYKSTIERYKARLANQELDPTTALSDTIAKVLYDNNVRARRTKVEDIEKMNYDRIIEIYKERFADANDFTFFFIGDIDIEELKPLLEKYIATLPVLKSKEKFKTIGQKLAKGTITNVFEKEQQTPAANVLFMYHAPMSDDLKNVLCVDILKQIMTMVYTETVREQEGGAYGIPVSSAVSDYPEKIGLVQITLPTSPDKRQHMTDIIYKGADDMVANGPKAEDLQKVKEYMLRSYAERIKTNGYWMNQLVNNVKEGKDNVAIYEKTVNSITAADIQNMAKRIFKSGNRIEVGMTAPSAK